MRKPYGERLRDGLDGDRCRFESGVPPVGEARSASGERRLISPAQGRPKLGVPPVGEARSASGERHLMENLATFCFTYGVLSNGVPRHVTVTASAFPNTTSNGAAPPTACIAPE